jgi:uncharacterized heparinase superfamily protein
MADHPMMTDTIEAGKRLVRAGGGIGLSLGERLSNSLNQLSWRTPLHAFRLKGRFPLKLLAVPDDEILGDPVRGAALIDGVIRFRGEAIARDAFDFKTLKPGTAFSTYMQSFAWLRDLATAAPRATCIPIAESLTRQWLDSHADHVNDAGWRAELWGQRVLFWTAHAPLILSSTDLVYRSAVLNALARGARHLERTADRGLPGVPRIAAWCGVVAAGLLIAGGETRLKLGEAGLARALALGFSDDGGLVSRTPGQQLEAVMLLTMLSKVYTARGVLVPDAIELALARAVPALLGVTLGDGALTSWQGGGPLGALAVNSVVEASGIRTRPLRQAREWGYQRFSAGATVLVIDAAPPPVSRFALGGCASTLAFELSDGAKRLIVNCGGAAMGGGHLPPELSLGLRTTAAHSTLVLGDANSTAVLASGALGLGVREIALDRKETDAGSWIETSHDGYARRFGLVHQRTLSLSSDGKDLAGEDALIPASPKRKPVDSHFAIRFHLAPKTEVTLTADGAGALLRIDGGALWQFRVRGGTLAVDDSLWVDGAARPHATQQLVLTGQVAGAASIGWTFKRAG